MSFYLVSARSYLGDVDDLALSRDAHLRCLVGARHSIDLEIQARVADARKDGVTWQEIGSALMMSRQAAHKRYGRSASSARKVGG